MSTIPFWPCPHKCTLWARTFDPSRPLTSHHPRCEHVDASLIDTWSVRIAGDAGGCIFDNEKAAMAMLAGEKNENPDGAYEIVPGRMHREIFERLPEFDGF